MKILLILCILATGALSINFSNPNAREVAKFEEVANGPKSSTISAIDSILNSNDKQLLGDLTKDQQLNAVNLELHNMFKSIRPPSNNTVKEIVKVVKKVTKDVKTKEKHETQNTKMITILAGGDKDSHKNTAEEEPTKVVQSKEAQVKL